MSRYSSASSNGVLSVPPPINEPVREYRPGAPETLSLQSCLQAMLGEQPDIPAIIGGQEVRTGDTAKVVCPHDHGHVLATYHRCGEAEVERAVVAAEEAWHEWSRMPWEARSAVFLKAAELLAGPWRDTLNASTMLGQSKTVFQAEIDSACEMVDFWRFNPHYLREILAQQPQSAPGMWNLAQYRALEGFIFAVTPFNFTSIAGNLPTAPALVGNTVLWKPASTAVLSGYYIVRLLEEAGLPPGVINFLPGSGAKVGNPVVARPELAGIHFTGSTGVFQGMWRSIGENIASYRSYPRIVGETGGKDFVFAHPSADPAALSTALIRGAFEYQGQKCSAASRAYIPRSLWGELEQRLGDTLATVAQGSPVDFSNFLAAVIDRSSFNKLSGAIDLARQSPDAEVRFGGGCDDSVGYFVEPTVVVASDPRFQLMEEELFGPLLTLFVYDDDRLDETLEICDTTSPYALTGAIFGRDRRALTHMASALENAAGNFYVNDKPTGAVVGQQPFGGSRASGTNDKAGSALNLLRWMSQRSVKETFVPPTDYRYPHQGPSDD
ncbi:MAG: L-glutamate gamma-semialdehyde dehydrogenase [Acidobacteriota bacterium]